MHIFVLSDKSEETQSLRKKEGKSQEYHERGLTLSSERKLSPKNLKIGQSGEVETCYSVSILTQFQIDKLMYKVRS